MATYIDNHEGSNAQGWCVSGLFLNVATFLLSLHLTPPPPLRTGLPHHLNAIDEPAPLSTFIKTRGSEVGARMSRYRERGGRGVKYDLEMEKSRKTRAEREERVQNQNEKWMEHKEKRSSPVVPFLIFTDLLQ